MDGPRFKDSEAAYPGEVIEGTPRELDEAAALVAATALDRSHAETLGAIVDSLVTVDQTIAGLMAIRTEMIDAARRAAGLTHLQSGERSRVDELSLRSLRAELGTALRLSERTAERMIVDSSELVLGLPHALRALHRGEISYRHAQILVEHARSLGDDLEARQELERRAVEWGKHLNAPRFERKVRELRERLHPERLEERHRRSAEDRAVEFEAGRDGMAWLTCHVPAVEAVAISERLDDEARRAARCPGETRTVAQLRADILCERLLAGEPVPCADSSGSTEKDAGRTPRFGGFRPTVIVTVPALTLLGLSSEPASLDGYGPIDPQTARELAAEAPSFIRVLVHPETGATLSVGRDRYAVPADLRTWLRVRDGTCRFPGCGRGARSCDVDHTRDWVLDGRTEHDNLAFLCRGHHVLKHSTRWSVTQARDGRLVWRSALGREHPTEPERRIRV